VDLRIHWSSDIHGVVVQQHHYARLNSTKAISVNNVMSNNHSDVRDVTILAYFPDFEKINVGLCDHHAVCVTVHPLYELYND
jgi:hypothetical protein